MKAIVERISQKLTGVISENASFGIDHPGLVGAHVVLVHDMEIKGVPSPVRTTKYVTLEHRQGRPLEHFVRAAIQKGLGNITHSSTSHHEDEDIDDDQANGEWDLVGPTVQHNPNMTAHIEHAVDMMSDMMGGDHQENILKHLTGNTDQLHYYSQFFRTTTRLGGDPIVTHRYHVKLTPVYVEQYQGQKQTLSLIRANRYVAKQHLDNADPVTAFTAFKHADLNDPDVRDKINTHFVSNVSLSSTRTPAVGIFDNKDIPPDLLHELASHPSHLVRRRVLDVAANRGNHDLVKEMTDDPSEWVSNAAKRALKAMPRR